MTGLDLLLVMGVRENYAKYNKYIKPHTLDDNAKKVLDDLDTYYKTFPKIDKVDWSSFSTWFLTVKNPRISSDEAKVYTTIFDNLATNTSPVAESVLDYFIKLDYATQALDLLYTMVEGTKTVDMRDIQNIVEKYLDHSGVSASEDEALVKDGFSKLLDDIVRVDGIEWGLEDLNIGIGPVHGGDFITVFARPETGKCLARGTPILMYDGSTRPVEEVVEGDLIMGPDSTSREASGIISGREPMYRIQYSNGEYYDVNESHILSLKRSKEEGIHKSGDILNVPLREYISWPKGRKDRYKGWKTGVDFPYTPLVSTGWIDPYIFGVWLGDGHSEGATFTNADEAVWIPIINHANNLSKQAGDRYYIQYQASNNTGTAVTCRITHGNQGKANKFKDNLRRAGVLNNKHIPNEYLINDRGVRLNVLAGLIDTDGSRGKHGFEITQKRKVLAEDILFLARSLGYSANLHPKIVSDVTYYRVSIYGDFTELNTYIQVKYKKILPKPNPKRKGLHFGFTVTLLGEADYFGFSVDRDHLFMLGDFTVTHNTTFITDQFTKMVPQIKDKNRGALIFNNEEGGDKIRLRLYQSALERTLQELEGMEPVVESRYTAKLGSLDRIKVIDRATLTTSECENFIKKYKPKLVAFNVLEKIKGFGKSTNEVERLKMIHQWAREMAKKYDCTVFAVAQADTTAEDQQWLYANQIYGSKTGVQGEADVIIGIGMLRDPSKKDLRYLHVSKNKLPGGKRSKPDFKHGYFEVRFDGDRGVYKTIAYK